MALLDHLGQSRAGEVGQLHGLEVGPLASVGVQLGRIGGEALDQPGPPGAAPGAHHAARTGSAGGPDLMRHDRCLVIPSLPAPSCSAPNSRAHQGPPSLRPLLPAPGLPEVAWTATASRYHPDAGPPQAGSDPGEVTPMVQTTPPPPLDSTSLVPDLALLGRRRWYLTTPTKGEPKWERSS
jgi:hypothetical protein